MTGYHPPSVEDCQSDNDIAEGDKNGLTNYAQGSVPRPQSPIQSLSTILKTGIEKLIGLPGAHAKAILRYSTMTRISEVLDLHCNSDWCLRPRTFAILWWLGCPLYMEQFIKDGLTDHFIPYSPGNLPKVIRGDDRKRFLELQKQVLPPEDLTGLEISGGKHIHFPKEDESDEQFEQMTILYNGKYSTVDRVRSRTSLDQFARKRIARYNASHLRDKNALVAFENELKALKALDHRHLVKLISTYTDPRYVGLIIKPVADMDLATYLKTKDPLERNACLRAFFGCLANALQYLHEKNVRHKDIKPMNILVKGTNVYFTDFGTARHWEGEGDGSTSGRDVVRTPRYCAPEVGDLDRRGKASDIWSLGCVFLEMATALNDESVDVLKDFMGKNGTGLWEYWKNRPAIALWIQHLRDEFKTSDDLVILQWIEWMLQESPLNRPDSLQMLNEIRENQGETSFIGSCCTAEQENAPIKQLPSNELPILDPPASNCEPSTISQQKKTVRFSEPSKASNPAADPSEVTERRFVLLSSDRRPPPTSEVPEEDHGDKEEDVYNVVAPAPLEPPSLGMEEFKVPSSTIVPSYILACSNRFTHQEMTAPRYNHGRVNLFVCGRFMFPSVIRAIAARSMESEYSTIHQRRLMPTADDWANVNKSLKHAAEAMTPAVLRGYDRWKPKGVDCAVLQQSRISPSIIKEISRDGYPIHSKPSGEVQGFIIRGLTLEALRYCDLLLSGSRSCAKKLVTKEEGQSKDSAQSSGPKEGFMMQEEVSVEICLKSGELTSVKAKTYVWTQGNLGLCAQWDPKSFIQRPGLRSLSSGTLDWTAEERELAKTMRMEYIFPGDILCSQVLKSQPEAVSLLLSQALVDPDAPCRFFGTALQAAASLGDEELVNMLLDSGADPNVYGGHYRSPLMAAVVNSRKTVAKLLLKERADVFVHGERFVSALYQAVGHSDWAMAQLLLDKGAWLGSGYEELLDLAAEQRDADMKRLLVDYDVQDLHENKPGYEFARRLQSRSCRGSRKSSSVGGVVLEEILANCSASGTWRGIKGVRIARAALAAGADPLILKYSRTAIDPVAGLISSLRVQLQSRGENREYTTEDRIFERVAGPTSSRRSRRDVVGEGVERRHRDNDIANFDEHLRQQWGSPPPYSRIPN